MVRISGEAKEIVRRRLLEEAAAHFARDGVDRANINSIAVAAGFAKGTIYNYFSSKEELFVGTLTMLYVQHWGSVGAWPTLEELPSLAVTAFLDGAGT